jgi:hypothetical protein
MERPTSTMLQTRERNYRERDTYDIIPVVVRDAESSNTIRSFRE